ncbi:MAG TPA: glycoside hydrolase family 18 protein [Flavisolibacter sp.]|nr:glycoside hydrolase family 18 protein [Flavisolibacter sp.]
MADTAVNALANQYQQLDQVIFASIAPTASGAFELTASDSTALATLKSKLGSSQQLLVSVGGAGASPNMLAMAQDPVKRTAYVNALIDFCTRWKIQGIDLKWDLVANYPTPVTAPVVPNASAYVALSQQLSAALHAKGMLFTEAIDVYYPVLNGSAVPDNSFFSLASQTYNYADQINLTCYGVYAMDKLGNQASIVQLQNWLGLLTNFGVPRSKIVVGVPFTGYPQSQLNSSTALMAYADIVAKANPEPTANNFGLYGFNGVDLIQTKASYLRQNGYGGILASDLSQDAPAEKFSLVNAIVNASK